ncbi:MAG: LemA family protein [Brachymonas sp.]|nr:LemA family protein [Brachymonas sp.]
MNTTLWIFVAVIVLLVVMAVHFYNRLVELRNRISNAFAQIDVQLKRRHDLVPNLVEVAKRYMEHEAQTLQAVIAARNQAQDAVQAARQQPADAQNMAALAMAEQGLMGSLSRLLAVAEAYPELKADARMRELSEELTSTENRVGFARQAYNDAVLEFNNAAQAFPALIVARLCNFQPGAMLQATVSENERQAPRVQF